VLVRKVFLGAGLF